MQRVVFLNTTSLLLMNFTSSTIKKLLLNREKTNLRSTEIFIPSKYIFLSTSTKSLLTHLWPLKKAFLKILI